MFDFQGGARWRRRCIGVGMGWWWDFVEFLVKDGAVDPIGFFVVEGCEGGGGEEGVHVSAENSVLRV